MLVGVFVSWFPWEPSHAQITQSAAEAQDIHGTKLPTVGWIVSPLCPCSGPGRQLLLLVVSIDILRLMCFSQHARKGRGHSSITFLTVLENRGRFDDVAVHATIQNADWPFVQKGV